MRVSKPFIRKFKGIPIYISYFVISVCKQPMIKSHSLILEVEPLGNVRIKTTLATNILDTNAFFDAVKIVIETSKKLRKKGKIKCIR